MERRRGRRDNGLDAADFVAVGDLDPRLAEHLLDLLGTQGIAAYLQPSMDVNPITRSSTVPDRPTDRLFADRAHLATARDQLRRLLAEAGTNELGANTEITTFDGDNAPAPREPDPSPGRSTASPPPVDATFAGIIADYDRPVDPTSAPWPAAENLPPAGQEPAAPEPAEPALDPVPAEPRHVDTWRGQSEAVEGEILDHDDQPLDRFVPPPPPPLPRLSRQSMLGGLAIVIGLVLLLAPSIGPFDRSDSIWLGFATILGGAVALILRLRSGTDPEDGQRPDDGARV